MGTSGSVNRARDSFIEENLRGQWFNTGRGPLNVPNGSALRMTLQNPVGSGKNLYVYQFSSWADTVPEAINILINPTTNLPTFALTGTSNRIGAPDGSGLVKADVGPPMTGGTTVPFSLPTAQDVGLTVNTVEQTLIIPPGVIMGAHMSNASGGASNMLLVIDWRETAQLF